MLFDKLLKFSAIAYTCGNTVVVNDETTGKVKVDRQIFKTWET